MKKYLEKAGRYWVSRDFIDLMKEKMGRLVSRLPGEGYHAYTDMTGSHEIFFVKHNPIAEFEGAKKIWEAKFHPGFLEDFLFFIQIVLKEEKMPRKRLVTEADFSIWNKQGSRTPSGQYGYTKKIEGLCSGANNRIRRKAASIIRKASRKDESVLAFLSCHSKRGKSLPAKIMIRAFQDGIPKFACEGEVCTCGGTCGCGNTENEAPDLFEALLQKEAASKDLLRSKLKSMFDRFGGRIEKTTLNREKQKLVKELRLPNPRKINQMIAQMTREGTLDVAGTTIMWKKGKMASKRLYGMYGYPQKTANLALQACNDLRMEAGHVASDLHMRKSDLYESITGFLTQHNKNTRCASSKLLLSVYPEEAMFRTATTALPDFTINEWLAYEPEP